MSNAIDITYFTVAEMLAFYYFSSGSTINITLLSIIYNLTHQNFFLWNFVSLYIDYYYIIIIVARGSLAVENKETSIK